MKYLVSVMILGITCITSNLSAMHAHSAGSNTELEQALARRKKLHEKKWKIERKLARLNWNLRWCDIKIALQELPLQIRRYPAYYATRVGALVAVVAAGVVAYQRYRNKDTTDEDTTEAGDVEQQENPTPLELRRDSIQDNQGIL